MAPTQTLPGSQPATAADQGHSARNAALATVVASELPAAGATAGVVAGALTVTQVVQASTALLTALKRFQMTRSVAFDAELRKEALAEAPTLGDVIDNIISRELGYEATFRNKQYERVHVALGPALAITDPKQRDAAVRAIFEKERRYTKMREEAMRVRTMAAVRHHHLEQASPEGAYWMLGEGVKQHTLDCLAMAHKFWPWSVLHAFQPPVHHGCACSLMGLQEAIANGLMTHEHIPDEMSAVAHATDVLQKAADAMRDGGISEADIESYLGAVLEEGRWEERFAKGTENAGRFRPRAGGDPGAMLLKRLGLGQRGKVMHELLPNARPLAASDRGRWTAIKGKQYRVPFATEWKRQIGGEVFHSPAGTTNVLRDGKLLSTPEVAPEARSAVLDRLAAKVSQARGRLAARRGAPLRAGDGPEHVLAMDERGFVPHRVVPAGPDAWKVSYVHDGTGSVVNATVTKRGEVKHADWDTSPIRAQTPRRSPLPPRTFAEHAQDALAWAHDLGKQHGVPVRVTGLTATNMLEDHAGWHEHSGATSVGAETARDIEAAGRARGAGRALTDAEKAGVWASYWTTAHEIAHGVNPIHPEGFVGEDADLEEALTEENAHRLAADRLEAQGQHDVLRWRDANSRALAVRGVYRKKRGALADILDAAGVTDPTERAHVVEQLKFAIDPATRFAVLGAMIHQAHPDVSVAEGERRARAAMSKGGWSRAAVPRSPGTGRDKWPSLFDAGKSEPKKKTAAKPKPPAVVIGGESPAPAKQGPVPSFAHIAMELRDKVFSFGKGAVRARGEGKDWIVKSHGGDKNHVASELLANAIYRAAGVNVPTMGSVQMPGGPDFSQVPDTLENEPPLPDTGRLSTGVIIRAANGKVTLIEPRNHYGGYVHTFPKGGLEAGLSAQQNALKELWEETGLHAHITGVVGDFKGDTGVTRYYVGVLTGGEPTPSEETEAIKTVTMKQAAEMLNKQRDRDVLAAVAKTGVPKGKFPDVFPPSVPGLGLAFQQPEGKKVTLKGPNVALGEGYLVDALLGNRDFVGPYGDNLRWSDESNPVRVNHAGVFERKEDGWAKPYGDVPSEVWALLYRGQGNGAVELDEDALRVRAAALAKTLTAKKLDGLVAAAPFTDEAERARVAAALKARLEWIRQFGAGEIDLPKPAEGAEARGLHTDSQAKFQMYPEEQQALDDFRGPLGDALNDTARAEKEPSKDSARIAKHLDNVLGDVKTAADSYAYIAADKDAGPDLVGKTIRQRGFTPAHTERDAAAGKTRIRVLLPGGAHALHVTDAEPGQPDMVLPRGARIKVTALRKGPNGANEADAILLPYERPGPLYTKPWQSSYKPHGKGAVDAKAGDEVWLAGKGKHTVTKVLKDDWALATADNGKEYKIDLRSAKPFDAAAAGKPAPGVPQEKKISAGDHVQLASGLPGKVVGTTRSAAGKWTARVMVDGKPYDMPIESLTKIPKPGAGMASPGTVVMPLADGEELGDGSGHRWPGEAQTRNFRYIANRDRAREIFREWTARSLAEARLLFEAEQEPSGVMVALLPHHSTARKLALDGGEDPGELHVTLAFLGKKDDLSDPEKLKATVRDWAARTAPLHGEISGHGLFTAGEEPVTYLSPDLPGLPAARQDLVDSLTDAGLPVSTDHGFSPHITLDYKDRSSDMPDRGGHKLRFSRATVAIDGERHHFKFGGKLEEAITDAPWSSEERSMFNAKHGVIAEGMGKRKDKDGYYVHTHRARSKSYPSPDAIPKSAVEFIESTS